MLLKITPKPDARYWAAILIASMCGTNFGDLFPDVLNVGTAISLVILITLFTVIDLANKMSQHGSEIFYWLAILVVRAAATKIADLLISNWHFSYLAVSMGIALFLAFLIHLQRKVSKHSTPNLPPINDFYWLTMLTAGTLGTVIGDGVGHSFGSVKIGVPISAVIATFIIALIFIFRIKLKWTTPVSYWVAMLAVRWWGTNFGDILAFLITVLGSIAVTGLLLMLILYFWPTSHSYKYNRL